MAAGSGVHGVLSVALCFIAFVATVRFIASDSDPACGNVATSALATCVAVGIFFPYVLPVAYIGYIAWTWFSIESDDEGVTTVLR